MAATTLAAMAVTGNTVSAFGLANAMAEDAAHIEEAPAEVEYGAEFEGDLADEIVFEAAEADAPVMEAEEQELADEAPEYDLMLSEAAPGEEEFNLGDIYEDAAPSDTADAQQTLVDLIDMAVAANRDQGLYAAANSAFATLADNADALANPETGVIEADGGQAQAIPLSWTQTEALCSYAGNRGLTPFDFLFNEMGFVPVISPAIDADAIFPRAEITEQDLSAIVPTSITGFTKNVRARPWSPAHGPADAG